MLSLTIGKKTKEQRELHYLPFLQLLPNFHINTTPTCLSLIHKKIPSKSLMFKEKQLMQ